MYLYKQLIDFIYMINERIVNCPENKDTYIL